MGIHVDIPSPFAAFEYRVSTKVGKCDIELIERNEHRPFVPKAWRGECTIDAQSILYRYFDDEGYLLYVGITDHLNNRDAAHMNSVWRPHARLLCIEGFPDRYTAETAESWSILAEDPIFNSVRRKEFGYRLWKYKNFIKACGGMLRGYCWDVFSLPDASHLAQPLGFPPNPNESLYDRHKRSFLEENRPQNTLL